MDYTTITKDQLKEIEKLKYILREKKERPAISTTLPNGVSYVTYTTDDIDNFWRGLVKNYSEDWVRLFNQTLLGFGMAIPWYKKYQTWKNLCPFCRIDPDMIDFCLSQRVVQTKNGYKTLAWSTFWSSIGGVIASLLFKTFS